jgi:hypothetical protein
MPRDHNARNFNKIESNLRPNRLSLVGVVFLGWELEQWRNFVDKNAGLDGGFEGFQLFEKLNGDALLVLVDPPDNGRAGEGQGVVLPGELRG